MQQTATQSNVPMVAPHIQAASHAFHAQQAAKQSLAPMQDAPVDRSGFSGSVGHFLHENRDWLVNKNPVGNAGYHWLRSALACVPYGLACGLVFSGANKLKGIKSGPWADITATPMFDVAAKAAEIGAGFTLYRTTSFAGRRFYERVFNPENSEADTIRELSESGTNFVNDWRENFDIQSHSVPWAAFTLGGIMVLGGQAAAARGLTMPNADVQYKLKDILQHSGIATMAYGSFFEVADQLGKRRRERQGIADPTKNINDIDMDTIEPGKVQDILDQPKTYGWFTDESGPGRWIFRRALPVLAGVGSYVLVKPWAMRIAGKLMNAEVVTKIPLIGEEGAKAFEGFLKKNAKAFDLNAKGIAEEISQFHKAEAKELTAHSGLYEKFVGQYDPAIIEEGVAKVKAVAAAPNAQLSITKNSFIEGVGTSLFAMYTFVKDPWERLYDGVFDRLERKANPDYYARKDALEKEGVELRIEVRKKDPNKHVDIDPLPPASANRGGQRTDARPADPRHRVSAPAAHEGHAAAHEIERA